MLVMQLIAVDFSSQGQVLVGELALSIFLVLSLALVLEESLEDLEVLAHQSDVRGFLLSCIRHEVDSSILEIDARIRRQSHRIGT